MYTPTTTIPNITTGTLTVSPRWNFCPQDGTKLEHDWNHCPKCGGMIGGGFPWTTTYTIGVNGDTWGGSSAVEPCLIDAFRRSNPDAGPATLISCPCSKCSPRC
jgi:hypothetical protein